MSEWSTGYVTDLAYPGGFYREQSPGILRLSCWLNAVETFSAEQSFIYCELGCGAGVTSLVLAASNPHDQFVAIDFNPIHIAHGRALARAALLTNIEFLEVSFEELVSGSGAPQLPKFDFITAHGVLSWVSRKTRRAIVEFMRWRLKPGGIAYLSYNAMPGWTCGLPVQRLLYDMAGPELNRAERSDRRILRAVALMDEIKKADAPILKNNPFVAEIERLSSLSRGSYLAHEYLSAHFNPQYHSDVAREMSAAKMSYAGSAALLSNFDELKLNVAQRQLLARIEQAGARESTADYLINCRFRSDVYIRGCKRLTLDKREELLRQVKLVLLVPRSQFKLKLAVHAGEAELSPTVYGAIADALADRPHTVQELFDLIHREEMSRLAAAEIVGVLVGSDQAFPVCHGSRSEEEELASRLNRVLADRADEIDPNGRIGLAVPSLGTGIYCSFLEAVVYRYLLSGGGAIVESAAKEVVRLVAARGDKVLRNGEAIEDEAEAFDVVCARVQNVTETVVPIWLKLLPHLVAGGAS